MNLLFKIVFFFALLSLLNKDSTDHVFHYLPSDLDVIAEEKESNSKRDKWIELMHKAAPNTNWRKIEQQNQFAKHLKNGSIDRDTTLNFLNGTWREIGSSNLAGRILVTDYDSESNEVICASSGGNLWKTNIDSLQWESLNDNFQINDICFLRKIPHDESERLLVASSTFSINGFFFSDDLGANWQIASGLENVAKWGKISKCIMQFDNTILLIAIEWDYGYWEQVISLYRSTDFGESFSKLESYLESEISNEDKIDIWTSNTRQSPVYMALGQEFVKYEDNEFTPIGALLAESKSIILKGIITEIDTTFYLANTLNGMTNFYASTNAGRDWGFLSVLDEGPFRKNSFTVSPYNKNNLFFGGINCYKSYDLGASWRKVNNWDSYYDNIENKLHADIPSIDIFQTGDEMLHFISTDGGLYLSKDSLKTVSNISLTGHNVGQYYSVYTSRVNTSFIHAGSQDQGYQKSNTIITTEPSQFKQVLSGDYGHIVSSDYGSSVWMVYPGFIIYYTDVINSEDSYRQNFDFVGNLWMPPLMADPYNPIACYIGGGSYTSGSRLIHVQKEGERLTFNSLAFNFTNASNAAISAMAFSPLNNDYWYVLNTDGSFYYSTDGGESWEKTLDYTAPEHHYFYGATILPSKAILGRVYVGGSGYSNAPVFVTNDNGITFEEMDNNLPSTLVYKLDSDENDDYIFAATEAGPYVYDNLQQKWFDVQLEQAPDQTYWDVDYIESLQIARFATYGRGIWDYMVNPENSIEQIVFTQEETDVFPNPSNGEFSISFAENSTWPKEITIFNSVGQQIKKEEIAYLYPGDHTISLQTQPGIYFVRISQPEGEEIVKFIIQ